MEKEKRRQTNRKKKLKKRGNAKRKKHAANKNGMEEAPEEEQSYDPLVCLPDELALAVLKYLHPFDLCTVCLVSRYTVPSCEISISPLTFFEFDLVAKMKKVARDRF